MWVEGVEIKCENITIGSEKVLEEKDTQKI